MFETPQFVTGPWKERAKPVFLEDREYGLALDALVKGCSDVLVVSNDLQTVLLGKRKVEPQPDWWYIGGRARPGETTQKAASRNVRRELGLDLAAERFGVVCNVSMVWAYREQAPKSNGTADISTIHCVRLTPAEEGIAQERLDPNEYSESKWWSIDDVIASGGDDAVNPQRFHPCLVSALKSLKAKLALEALEEACGSEGKEDASEQEIARLAREFVRKMKASKAQEPSVRVLFDAEAEKYVRREEEPSK